MAIEKLGFPGNAQNNKIYTLSAMQVVLDKKSNQMHKYLVVFNFAKGLKILFKSVFSDFYA